MMAVGIEKPDMDSVVTFNHSSSLHLVLVFSPQNKLPMLLLHCPLLSVCVKYNDRMSCNIRAECVLPLHRFDDNQS